MRARACRTSGSARDGPASCSIPDTACCWRPTRNTSPRESHGQIAPRRYSSTSCPGPTSKRRWSGPTVTTAGRRRRDRHDTVADVVRRRELSTTTPTSSVRSRSARSIRHLIDDETAVAEVTAVPMSPTIRSVVVPVSSLDTAKAICTALLGASHTDQPYYVGYSADGFEISPAHQPSTWDRQTRSLETPTDNHDRQIPTQSTRDDTGQPCACRNIDGAAVSCHSRLGSFSARGFRLGSSRRFVSSWCCRTRRAG
jgi:hypothetical protein